MARRRPCKMDTYADGPGHPTRENPQTLKAVGPNISLFKTLCRVYLCRTEPRPTYDEVVTRALRHMPFMTGVYRTLRKDIDTHRHLRKEMLDAVGTVTSTMVKYGPPYPHPRLSPRKRAEVLYALRILDAELVLGPTTAVEALGPGGGDDH